MKFAIPDTQLTDSLKVILIAAGVSPEELPKKQTAATRLTAATDYAAVPTVSRHETHIQIVGDASTLNPAQAFLLAKELTAAAFAATRGGVEELGEKLRFHERELHLSAARTEAMWADPAAGED